LVFPEAGSCQRTSVTGARKRIIAVRWCRK